LKVAERKTSNGSRVGFRVDITELEQARAAAEEAFQVKSEFISVLSHELRTPLTVILGYAKVLASVKLLKSARQLNELISEGNCSVEVISDQFDALLRQISGQARKMESSGSHLLMLINDLLDYSKIEQGHFQLNLEEFSLKSVVSSVVEDMSDMAFEKGISLEDESRDMTLVADKIRFKQVMINLIGNAIKFTDTGCVIVSTAYHEGEVEISVSDTGQGIAEDKLSMIFEAFKQADLTDRRAAGGTGLGLAISKSITEMHSGRLTVESELGRGSTFTVKMPLQAIVDAPRLLNRMSRPLLTA
jgi:signal transduction histidine kinase